MPAQLPKFQIKESKVSKPMRKIIAILFVITLALGCRVAVAQAQEETPPSGQSVAAKPAAQENMHNERPKPVQPFRLDFILSELENGKKINTRHCSMNLTAGNMNEIKIGTRVPVSTGEGSLFQYMDVGTNIWANLREVSNDLQLEVKSDVSNLDMSSTRDHSTNSAPIVRQIQLSGKTLLVVGKPMTIGKIDDPNSNHEFQLDVTATKLR
jgi:hypothetical protein